MKIIIHPGHGKCGSSSIQGWIQNNLEILGSKGYAIPGRHMDILNNSDSFSITSFYLKNIVTSGQQELFKRDLQTLIERIRNTDTTVLWSDEFLTDPRIMTEDCSFHKTISEFFDEPKVIYYIRRQDDFVLSGWQQWRHKIGRTLEEECEVCIRDNNPDYLQNILKLENVYGSKNIIVRFFDKNNFLNGDLIEDFMLHTGIILSNYNKPTLNANIALNPHLCDILSNVHDGLYEDKLESNRIKIWLEKNINSEILHNPNKDFMSVDLRKKVMSHFYKENRELHKRYFPESDFDSLFGEKKFDVKFDEIKRLKEIIALQFELIHSLDKKINHLKNKRSGSSAKRLMNHLKRLYKK